MVVMVHVSVVQRDFTLSMVLCICLVGTYWNKQTSKCESCSTRVFSDLRSDQWILSHVKRGNSETQRLVFVNRVLPSVPKNADRFRVSVLALLDRTLSMASVWQRMERFLQLQAGKQYTYRNDSFEGDIAHRVRDRKHRCFVRAVWTVSSATSLSIDTTALKQLRLTGEGNSSEFASDN